MVEKEIGEITNYFSHVKAAAIKLSAPLKVGDKIRIVGGEKNIEMDVKSMQIDRKSVTSAKKGDEIGLLVSEDVNKGYKVFKI
jgi:translation elongation factor EF-Tu-like GTPase